MGLVTATRTCLRKYVDFGGRARRSEFWWFYLATSLVIGALTALAVIVFLVAAASSSSSDTSEISAGGGAALIVAVILYGLASLVSLALFLPFLGSAVRRLHDTDRSGWWYLLGLTGIGFIVLVVFWVMEGTPGPNRFGPSPKGAGLAGGQAPHGQSRSYDRGGQERGHPAQA